MIDHDALPPLRGDPGAPERPLSRIVVAVMLIVGVLAVVGFIAHGFWANAAAPDDASPKRLESIRVPRKNLLTSREEYVSLPFPEPMAMTQALPPDPLPPVVVDDGSHQQLLDAEKQTQEILQHGFDRLGKTLEHAVKPPVPAAPPKDGETAAQRRARIAAERKARIDEEEARLQKMRTKAMPQWVKPESSSAQEGPLRVKRLRTPWSLAPYTVITVLTEAAVTNHAPGPFRGYVSNAVKDSATGTIVVLPQGTVVGFQPAGAAILGDERLAVKGDKIVYRDRHILLPPHGVGDRMGTSGLADQVEHHYLRTVLLGLVTSVLKLGNSVSVGSFDASVGEQLGANVGREMSQQGQREVQQYLRTEPTITIRASYQATIMLTEPLELNEPLL